MDNFDAIKRMDKAALEDFLDEYRHVRRYAAK